MLSLFMRRKMNKLSTWLITLLVPLALIGTALRLLLTPAFLAIEYRMPGFPHDPYGFTIEERLHWGKLTTGYLVSAEPITFFNKQKLPDGKPLYNTLELSHMTDVKNLITLALRLWQLALMLLLTLCFIAWQRQTLSGYCSALKRGAWLTLTLMGAIVLFSAIAFNHFFEYFHQILFIPGTWTFYESDTFIRLFPERFWQDAFLWGGAIIALQVIALLLLTRKSTCQ